LNYSECDSSGDSREELGKSECISVGARSQNGNRVSQVQSACSHKEELREVWEEFEPEQTP
jgi:hypothetical protein